MFKDIPGFEGHYAATSCGRIWSHKSQKFLKPTSNGAGYLVVNLSKEGKIYRFYVHRLVGLTYLPNPDNLPQINHKDENKQNNNINNIEWCDCQYNINYGEHNKKSSESRKQPVYCVELDRVFDSAKQAGEELGISRANISSCLAGRRLSVGGYHWQRVQKNTEED